MAKILKPTLGVTLTKANEMDRTTALVSAQFHPDGSLFGVGTADSAIKIWDIKSRLAVAQERVLFFREYLKN